jgi:hypothetical protein
MQNMSPEMAPTGGPMAKERKIYLHEADEFVGPFFSRKDAERFILLMEWYGENSEGIEIVEVDADESEPLPWQPGQALAPDLEPVEA